MRIYLIQMGVRVGCIVGAVAVGRGWLLWVFIAAAVVLPYTAVIFVNAGRDQSRYDTSPVMFDAAGRPVLDVPRHGSIAGREAGGEPGPADGPPDPAGHRTQRGRAADSSI